MPRVSDRVTWLHATPPQFRLHTHIHPCMQEQQEPVINSFKTLTCLCSKNRQALTAVQCRALTLTHGSPEGLAEAWLSKLLCLHLVSSAYNIPKGRLKHLFCNRFFINKSYSVKCLIVIALLPWTKGNRVHINICSWMFITRLLKGITRV